jgi:hypothetical protein
MTETPRRLIEIGILPTGYGETFTDGPDPLAVMLREGNARLDRERQAEAKAKAAKLADEARERNTRRARAMRRLGKALKFLRG